MRFVRGVNAIDERFEIALHDCERRAELVAHVREEAPALLLPRLEAARHRVERARKSARFAWSAYGHSRREVAVRDASDRVDHVADRSGQAAERPRREDDPGQHDEEHKAARDVAPGIRRAERAGQGQKEKGGRDDGQDGNRKEEERHATHEPAAPGGHRPAPPSSWRKGLVFRPPRRALPPLIPTSLAAHSSSSAKR
jgi:hypothetical protein